MTKEEIRFRLINAILLGPANELETRLERVINDICYYIDDLRLMTIMNEKSLMDVSEKAFSKGKKILFEDNDVAK